MMLKPKLKQEEQQLAEQPEDSLKLEVKPPCKFQCIIEALDLLDNIIALRAELDELEKIVSIGAELILSGKSDLLAKRDTPFPWTVDIIS
jgi:hypothetical protein